MSATCYLRKLFLELVSKSGTWSAFLVPGSGKGLCLITALSAQMLLGEGGIYVLGCEMVPTKAHSSSRLLSVWKHIENMLLTSDISQLNYSCCACNAFELQSRFEHTWTFAEKRLGHTDFANHFKNCCVYFNNAVWGRTDAQYHATTNLLI